MESPLRFFLFVVFFFLHHSDFYLLLKSRCIHERLLYNGAVVFSSRLIHGFSLLSLMETCLLHQVKNACLSDSVLELEFLLKNPIM